MACRGGRPGFVSGEKMSYAIENTLSDMSFRVGYSISAFFICLTGRVGAVYHISFPVMNRASFGIFGSLWPVLNRALMAW